MLKIEKALLTCDYATLSCHTDLVWQLFLRSKWNQAGAALAAKAGLSAREEGLLFLDILCITHYNLSIINNNSAII